MMIKKRAYKQSSLSDNIKYPDFCVLAAKDHKIFNSFRKNSIYSAIVETVTFEQGLGYLKVILSQSPELVEWFDEFRRNDKYGGPITYDYGVYGKFSPTTLRYIKVLSDLKFIFSDLNGDKIIEIGAGYGGLCRIISEFFNIKSYAVVDLKPVLNLIEKYLSNFNVKNIRSLTLEELNKEEKYDLVISNYALSECQRTVQQSYFDKVVKNCSKGYITWNFIGYRDSFTIKELFEKIKDSKILASKPHSFSASRILFWGDNNKRFTALFLFYFNLPSKIKSIFGYVLIIYFNAIGFLIKKSPFIARTILSLKKKIFHPKAIRQEKREITFYSKFIKKGDLCFDVGANIGNKTNIFLRLGAKVVAIEPQELACQKINIFYGDNKNLMVINRGLSDKPGFLKLSIGGDCSVLSTMSEKWKKEGDFSKSYTWTKTEKVPVTTLDRLISEYGLPKFCKIDVEGFEARVLKGLSQSIPYISFEFHKTFLEDAKECVKHAMSLGPARFNFSIGESAKFFFKNWVLQKELFKELEKAKEKDLWGDIYITFLHS